MQKVESIPGKQKITYNGYVYVKQKNLTDGVISYECEKACLTLYSTYSYVSLIFG